MKGLTLHQPWASLIADGRKTFETRGWSHPYRGLIAIHAGKTHDVEYSVDRGYRPEGVVTGAIIAVGQQGLWDVPHDVEIQLRMDAGLAGR